MHPYGLDLGCKSLKSMLSLRACCVIMIWTFLWKDTWKSLKTSLLVSLCTEVVFISSEATNKFLISLSRIAELEADIRGNYSCSHL